MNLLYDTNILIHIAKHPNHELLTQVINPSSQKVFISIVSIAELKSIALQNNWGAGKLQVIDIFLNEVILVEINENLANTYVEIDAFSQRRNPFLHKLSFFNTKKYGQE